MSNKKLNVYVVVQDWAIDYEQSSEVVGVFYTKQDAIKCMEDSYNWDKNNADYDYVEELSELSKCYYSEGYYCRDHYLVFITEKEVK